MSAPPLFIVACSRCRRPIALPFKPRTAKVCEECYERSDPARTESKLLAARMLRGIQEVNPGDENAARTVEDSGS